ncbi:MAG: response regulator SirA [Tardiphaga sp.]|nr:response regulator SirA [Tardiphaga sp.]
MATVTLDLAGLKCPLPALKTKKALARLNPGDRLEVICTDPMAAIDIPHLVNAVGARLIASSRHDINLTFLIEKGSI